MTESQLQHLLQQYKNNELPHGEVQVLLSELRKEENIQRFPEILYQMLEAEKKTNNYDAERWEPVLQRVLKVDKEDAAPSYPARVHRIHFLKTIWFRYAAAILIIGAGIYLFTTLYSSSDEQQQSLTQNTDIPPGRDGAVLTLSDGTQILLDSINGGIIATQNGSDVVLNNGRLDYTPGENSSDQASYNTMTTPKGRQFKIQLSDGTTAWLNAASSITYPTVFVGNERRVEVTGEIYFEVAKNAKKPFKVKINNRAEIEVLGTHFNVSAYNNEPLISTTLIEGSVKVNGTIIKPGQQAQLENLNNQNTVRASVVENVDIDKIMAWKNGLFNFEGASMAEIMRQLERWYDIDVVYGNGEPTVEFEGKMTKDVSLNGLINLMEKAGIKLRLEGRKLIVLP